MLPLGDCMKKEFQKQIQQFEEALRLRQSFDLVVKPLCVQGINMRLYFVDGFAKDEILEKMLEFLMKAELRECIEKESVSKLLRTLYIVFGNGNQQGYQAAGKRGVEWNGFIIG